MRTYTETITLQETTCASCGITFAVPQHWLRVRGQTGERFWCPNGHVLTYSDSVESKLRQELAREQERTQRLAAQLTAVQDQLKASEHEMKRQQKRVANGVCPCCNRSFAQLGRHMKTKHPDYAQVPGVKS